MAVPTTAATRRSSVLWTGSPPSRAQRQLLTDLDLQLQLHLGPPKRVAEPAVIDLACAVFAQSRTKPNDIVAHLGQNVDLLLDYRCVVLVIAADLPLSTLISRALARWRVPSLWPTVSGTEVFDGDRVEPLGIHGLPSAPFVQVALAASLNAATIARLALGAGPWIAPALEQSRLFTLRGRGSRSLTSDERLLLRFAFHDCDRVRLTSIGSGRSGARVLTASAQLRARPTRRALPFLVKLADRPIIEREWFNYEMRVRQFVPFHLAPRLVTDRCYLGARGGIIVGDFVESSELLLHCARHGRATAAIGALFESTLRGWRLQASLEAGLLSTALGSQLRREMSQARMRRAMKRGGRHTFAELVATLQSRPKEEVLWGPIHGDLHSENVCVRASDAILIDFGDACNGPLLADAASLEVSLLVRSPSDDRFDRAAWFKTARELLNQKHLRQVPDVPDISAKYSWMASCVRQVRLYALSMERRPGQYADVLAYYLLNAAAREPRARGAADFRRTSALLLAERLLGMRW